METKNKQNNLGRFKSALAIAALGTLGIAAFNGSRPGEVKETTSIYQGFHRNGAKKDLVFDESTKPYRIPGTEDLVISGNPDTLKIGNEYTVKYTVPRWEYAFPEKTKILSIK